MRIIPAIDILNGKCVRLTMGNFASVKIYDGSPLDAAKRFEDEGFRYLHLVDLDGAREGKIINHKILGDITGSTSLKVDFGGGIKSDDDIDTAISSGASQIVIGTVAAVNPGLFLKWLSKYGAEKMILSADSKNRKIMISGWAEKTGQDILDFIEWFAGKGVNYVSCTDISRDGTMLGPATELYREITGKTDINVIASGGISSISDVILLKDAGCEGAIIGKALYEGKINLNELSQLC